MILLLAAGALLGVVLAGLYAAGLIRLSRAPEPRAPLFTQEDLAREALYDGLGARPRSRPSGEPVPSRAPARTEAAA